MNAPYLPDLLLLATGVAVLLVDAGRRDEEGALCGRVAMAGCALVVAALFLTWPRESAGWPTYVLGPHEYRWRLFFTVTLLFTQWFSTAYFRGDEESAYGGRPALTRPGAFHALLLFCTTGMFALVSARDLLTLFVALELATLPLFALAGFQSRQNDGVEAASKLVVTAGLAVALNLFGISLLYGASGGLSYAALAAAAAHPGPALWLGTLLVFGGLAFKISAVPFQMWAPDVYEGAPTPVTAFLSVASKAAGLAALAVLFFGPLDALRARFYPVLATAAVITMSAGNLGAIRQTRMRRFIAYSSIAQAGYFLLAFTGAADRGRNALMFNLWVYGAANLALFYVMRSCGPRRKETLRMFRGLSLERPGLALLLLLSLFSLAGLPPLAGFLGKFQLFSVAAAGGHYPLVFIALANAVVSLYYYLQPVREAYISAADPDLPAMGRLGWFDTVPLWVLGAAVALLAVWPGPFLGR